MARWVRFGLSVAGPFVCRCLTILTMLRFHIPLIEPDVPVSGIRLSEKVSRCRPREATRPRSKADEAHHLIEEWLREPAGSRPDHFVFGT